MGWKVDPRRVVWGASAKVPILTLQGSHSAAYVSWQICPSRSNPTAAIVSQKLNQRARPRTKLVLRAMLAGSRKVTDSFHLQRPVACRAPTSEVMSPNARHVFAASRLALPLIKPEWPRRHGTRCQVKGLEIPGLEETRNPRPGRKQCRGYWHLANQPSRRPQFFTHRTWQEQS